MRRFWKDLSVSKKLYMVVGIMAFLIATELLTLLFAMDTLSSVRSFVGGEGLWSKAQKNAVHSLHRYAFTSDKKYYDEFHNHLRVPLGDRQARLELMRPQPDLNKVREGFIQGQIHPQDINGLIKVLQRFHWISYIKSAVTAWTAADQKMDELIEGAEQLNQVLSRKRKDPWEIRAALHKIDQLNGELTVLENDFSQVLGEGSRWLENLLMWLLVIAVFTVEGTGLFLTVSFSRNLSRSLWELNRSASEVGRGNFSHIVPVRSRDELGQLAVAINKMTRDLKNSIGRRQQAESANQIKTMFLANMSHEIRTPLGVIIGLAEVLKDPGLSRIECMNYIDTIEKTGKNLTRIINDILDISKVEADHIEIQKAPFVLQDFMSELNFMMKMRAEKKRNALVFRVNGVLPSEIYTDRIRLRQILVNLIGNALKFTEGGIITVSYGIRDTTMSFEISDTGIGIPPEYVENLFQPFSQADNTSTRSHEGTGLGLFLSKKLAQALGGDVILLKSEPSTGSVFRVTVRSDLTEAPQPAETPTTAPPTAVTAVSHVTEKRAGPASAESTLKGKKVLVVEDAPDNQLLIRLFLTKIGVQVVFANNGQEGVDKAMAENFDLVLMDMQMPVMDGYTATHVLRDKGFKRPIIALTAHAMKEDRDRCLQAGCDDYLTKPVDSTILQNTILKYATQASPSEGRS